jgi:hypothetical protein
VLLATMTMVGMKRAAGDATLAVAPELIASGRSFSDAPAVIGTGSRSLRRRAGGRGGHFLLDNPMPIAPRRSGTAAMVLSIQMSAVGVAWNDDDDAMSLLLLAA